MNTQGRVVNCYGSLSQQRFATKHKGKCHRRRCNRCNIHPVCKSKDKAKGSMKMRSIDAGYELTKHSFGSSATGVLAYLAHAYAYDYDYDCDDRVEEENSNYSYTNPHHDGTSFAAKEHENDIDVDDDDDAMSFCDVGLCWGQEDGDEYGDDDDGWYLVGGQMH